MREILRTPRLRLRELHPGDLDALTELFSSPDVMRYFPSPLDRHASAVWLARTLARYERHGFGLWGVEPRNGGALLGVAGLVLQQLQRGREVEVGGLFRPTTWGRGVAVEAGTACVGHALGTLRLPRVVAIVHPDNLAAERCALRLGLSYLERVDFWVSPEAKLFVRTLAEHDPELPYAITDPHVAAWAPRA